MITPAPVSIGRVALTVNDAAAMTDYYRKVVGLEVLSSDGTVTRMGAGDATLLELRSDPAARRASPKEAGLFHTAFLLPTRSDLGAWIRMAVDRQIPVAGASDHAVSEAIYLTDPEGNGIEIYADRAEKDWPRKGEEIGMTTEALNVAAVAGTAKAPWKGAPTGTTVGHVHLQVGALPEADDFYRKTLGMDLMATYPGAYFWATGGYHHHLATNIWNSRNAPQRSYPATGLAEVELVATANSGLKPGLLTDPWGTQFGVRAA